MAARRVGTRPPVAAAERDTGLLSGADEKLHAREYDAAKGHHAAARWAGLRGYRRRLLTAAATLFLFLVFVVSGPQWTQPTHPNDSRAIASLVFYQMMGGNIPSDVLLRLTPNAHPFHRRVA